MPFYEDLQKRIRGARMEVFEDAGPALFVDEADVSTRCWKHF